MNSKGVHYRLLWVALGLCSFIYIDIYLVPSKFQAQTVLGKWKSVSQSRRYGGTWCWMETNIEKYKVCPAFYDGLQIGQPVILSKSVLSTSYRKLDENTGEQNNSCDISFIRDSGMVYLTFVSVLAIIIMIVYEKIRYKPAKKHVTLYVLISAIVLFCLHVFN